MDLGLLGEILEQYYYFICSIPEFSNKVGEYLKDSKDVIIALLAIIFAIYIPLVIKYYDLIDESTYKKLDLEIFKKRFFNLPKLFFYSVAITVLMFFGWNENTILFILPLITFFLFLIISGLIKLSKFINDFISDKLFNERLGYLSKQEFNDEILIYFNEFFNDEKIFKNYQETKKIFQIFFRKIHGKIEEQKKGDWKNEQLIRNLFFLYKKLKENSQILNLFKDQDFKLLLNIYKSDNENKFSYLSGDIMKIIISKMEMISGDTYLIIESLKTFLEQENDNFRFKFLSHFHSEILQSEILLEDRGFMEKYGKDIFYTYKDLEGNILGNRTRIKNEVYQKLIQILQFEKEKYNDGYDNILRFWLLDYEIILFTRLLYLYYAPFGENRAISILEHKIVFGGIGRVKTYWGDGEKDIEAENKQEEEDTIRLFVKEFGGNKQVLENLKIQFQEIIDENTRDERDIRKSKYYIKLIDRLIEEGEKMKKEKDEK